MNKAMTVFLASLLSATSAFAAEARESVDMNDLIPADQLEASMSDSVTTPDSDLSLDFQTEDRRDGRGDRYPRYPGHPGHPHYPERPHYPDYPSRPNYPGRGYPARPFERVVCYAVDGRGVRFDAVGEYASQTQQWAMDECYQSSRYCRPAGCHQIN